MKSKYLLRVISGKFKGKGLMSPPDMSVRPTSQRVKDSLFNIIRCDIYGRTFLDLFSGTGQVGIEAISNGASATFVDADTRLLRLNIKNVGCESSSIVCQGDFKNILNNLHDQNKTFDFIFADPPYRDGLYIDIISGALPLLSENGVLILEHASDQPITHPLMYDSRKYGSRMLTFIRRSL